MDNADVMFGAAIAAMLGLGGAVGYIGLDRIFASGIVTRATARKLLLTENLTSWNAFRRANPDWRPDLRGIDLRHKSLRDVDLTNCDLSRARFNQAILDGADLSDSTLHETSFEKCSARGTVFDRADFKNTTFQDAELTNASFTGTNTEEAKGRIAERATAAQAARPPGPAAEDSLQWMADLHPVQFEQYVATLFKKRGYTVTIPDGPVRADLIVQRDSIAGATEEIVEAKRLSSPDGLVHIQLLRQLEAVRTHLRASSAYFVTNGRLSSAARAFVELHPEIQPIEGPMLRDLNRTLDITATNYTEHTSAAG